MVLVVLLGGRAMGDPVPPKSQALLLLRILAYDHKLADRVDNKKVTIFVVEKAGATDADALAGELTSIAKSTKLAGNTIQVVTLTYNDKTFEADVGKLKGAAMFVAPSLGDSLGVVTAVTAKYKLLSFAGNVDHVASGLSVGFANEGGKPVISVNLAASRNEGADLDVALLRVAKIVKK